MSLADFILMTTKGKRRRKYKRAAPIVTPAEIELQETFSRSNVGDVFAMDWSNRMVATDRSLQKVQMQFVDKIARRYGYRIHMRPGPDYLKITIKRDLNG